MAGGTIGTRAAQCTPLPIAARRALALARGATEAWGAGAGSIFRRARCSIAAHTELAAASAPRALWAALLALQPCPPRQAVALSSDGVTAICMGTLAALPTASTKCPIRAGLVAMGAVPSWGAATDPTLCTASGSMGTVATPIAARAPGAIRTRFGAVRSVPTFLADAGAIDGGAHNAVLAGAALRAVHPKGV